MNRDQQKESTEQIWRALSDRLRQFVRSRIESVADVDDILQTVFLRIHQNIDQLRQAERLESWVFQIARNAVTDHYRRKRDTHALDRPPLVDSTNADEQKPTTELAGCLTTFIARLPIDQRRAVSMYELDGRSQKDIADHESISVSGAKSRIQRGRQSLERMLKACCEFQFDVRGNVVEYQSTDTDCCDERCE